MFQLEKSLKAQIDVWEQEHGKEFLVNGQKFLEYVQQQWDHHHTEKEKEKLERVCYSFDLKTTLSLKFPRHKCRQYDYIFF